MEIVKHSGKEERRILIWMITNKWVANRVASVWKKEGLFLSKWANLIGHWVCQYSQRYNDCPGKKIEAIFEQWATKGKDKETAEKASRFLASLSEQYEQHGADCNPEYAIDVAASYFNEASLKKLHENLQACIDTGQYEVGLEAVSNWGKIQIGLTAAIDVFRDKEAIRMALEQKSDPIITYKGALGELFDDVFERDGFVSFMASEKRGKSWWLGDVAWQAVAQGRRVAYFSVGDMSEAQQMRRWIARACKRPIAGRAYHYPKEISSPTDEHGAHVKHETISRNKPITTAEARAAMEEAFTKENFVGDRLKLASYRNDTAGVQTINEQLALWEDEDWIADVIVIDYADLLVPLSTYKEPRDQINQTWKALRRLSQERHCCVITATQADAASYNAHTLNRAHFSEDKRKYAHVTAMMGISQTDFEKKRGIMRINMIQRREGEFDPRKCVHVATCLPIGRVAVRSCW